MAAWLVYARDASEQTVHISEVQRGDKDLFCPYCHRRVSVKKGKIKVHHFAHIEETCAFYGAYDFLGIEEKFDTSLSLTGYAAFKKGHMEQRGIELEEEARKLAKEWKTMMKVIEEGKALLWEISECHPKRKKRSARREANFEVFQELEAFLNDHNASFPDFGRVVDPQPEKGLKYAHMKFLYPHRSRPYASVIYYAYASALWQWEYEGNYHTPEYLVPMVKTLFDNYSYLRRKKVAAELTYASFKAEKERFDLFRLYFLAIRVEKGMLFKIGITSRPKIESRIEEIKSDLKHLEVMSVELLCELSGYSFLEAFFKAKYAKNGRRIGSLSEYFEFSHDELEDILNEFKRLGYSSTNRRESIRQGMQKAKSMGKHIGRSKDGDKFLQKPKSKQIVSLLQEGLCLREIERKTGFSINTIRKVNTLLMHEGN